MTNPTSRAIYRSLLQALIAPMTAAHNQTIEFILNQMREDPELSNVQAFFYKGKTYFSKNESDNTLVTRPLPKYLEEDVLNFDEMYREDIRSLERVKIYLGEALKFAHQYPQRFLTVTPSCLHTFIRPHLTDTQVNHDIDSEQFNERYKTEQDLCDVLLLRALVEN